MLKVTTLNAIRNGSRKKNWQVLLQMYALKQMRNHHSLKW